MNTGRRRRALLYVPGDDLHKIQKAVTLQVDSICMDLEDGVAAKCKAEAQKTIRNALGAIEFLNSERLVRINPLQSGMMENDLDIILQEKPDGVVLPKVENAEVVKLVSSRISDCEVRHGWETGSIRLIGICESASGILNLHDICHADPRLDGVIFGGEDLAADLGAERTGDAREIFVARSLLVLHATEARIQAIDLVCTDYRDIQFVRKEAEDGARMGFTGKQVIHPNQVDIVQAAFTPSAKEIEEALKVLREFHKSIADGKGAFGLEGKMVDMPVVRRARNILQRAGIAEDSASNS